MVRLLISTFCLAWLGHGLAKVCPVTPDTGDFRLVQYYDSKCTKKNNSSPSDPSEFSGTSFGLGQCRSMTGLLGTSRIPMSYQAMCQNKNTYLKSYLGPGCASCASFTIFNETESAKLFAGGCAAQVRGYGGSFMKFDNVLNAHCGCGDIGSPSYGTACTSNCTAACTCSSSCTKTCSSVDASFKVCGTCGTSVACNPSASDYPPSQIMPAAGGSVGSVPKALTCRDIKKAYQTQKCCTFPGGAFTVPTGRRLVDDVDGDIESDIAGDDILAFVQASMNHINKMGGKAQVEKFARAVNDMMALHIDMAI